MLLSPWVGILLLLGPWVGILIYFLQLFERGVGVDLRRLKAFMPPQLLHTLKSGTIVQHRCGKAVSQHMR